MKNNYPAKNLLFIITSFLLFTMASCKKDNKMSVMPALIPKTATPTRLGLYEADSAYYKILLTAISKIGNNTVDYDLEFDTGSGGMVIDANGILSPSMITSKGFNFTGDSRCSIRN